jgi:Glucose-regulated metallo-peptidase M90
MRFIFLIIMTAVTLGNKDLCDDETLADKMLGAVPKKDCPTDQEAIAKRVEEEYRKFYSTSPLKTAKIKGVTLSGSEEEIKAVKDILTSNPPNDWEKAAAGCETTLCALSQLVGSPLAAKQLLNIKPMSGYTLSLGQGINKGAQEQIWSVSEINEIYAAVTKLPPELMNLNGLDKIKRMANGYRKHEHSGNVAAYASPGFGPVSGEIVFYETGLSGLSTGVSPLHQKSWPQEVLVHELCHHHDFQGMYKGLSFRLGSERKDSEWGKLSGWEKGVTPEGYGEWKRSPEAKFISGYAQTNPVEDFAESCMNYILNPENLKKETPEKYQFLKENVFNQKEFKDQIWNGPQSWPKLNQLLASPEECTKRLSECAATTKIYKFQKVESALQETKCFKNFKEKRINSINQSLSSQPDYCEKGGPTFIFLQKEKMCQDVIENYSTLLNSARDQDYSNATKTCQSKKDFSAECLFKETGIQEKIPSQISPALKKLLIQQVPDRHMALASELKSINSSLWLKPCLETASKISSFQMSDGRMDVIYTSKSTGMSDNLGQYIYQNYSRDDINTDCAQSILTSLTKNGYKVPEDGNAVNVLLGEFQHELKSLEAEVIQPLRSVGCTDDRCKKKKISELLKVWEQKSQSRSSFSEKKFIEELVKKLDE